MTSEGSPLERGKREKGGAVELRSLSPSLMSSAEDIGQVKSAAADVHNGWGATRILRAGTPGYQISVTVFPVFVHAIVEGLVPPFSLFFCVVLNHYRLQLLHLLPDSVILLAMFAYLCETYLGVRPSVALLRHFFRLEVVDGTRCPGCMYF